MEKSVLLRADAYAEIGYGHFIRTLSLAEMLAGQFKCIFATQTPTPYQKEEVAKVCDLMPLPSGNEKMSTFLDVIRKDDIVVLDNYFFDESYERAIRDKGAKVVLIDNLHQRHSAADVIIGFAPGLDKNAYSVEPYTKLYLGTEYTLLRKPFVEQIGIEHSPIGDYSKLKVVISMGGADKYGISDNLVKKIAPSKVVEKVTVICGDSAHLEKSPFCNVVYLGRQSATEMRNLFVDNDVAILPASTTTIEAISCGIPVIGGYYVSNQHYYYQQCVKNHAIKGFGDLRDNDSILSIKDFMENGNLARFPYNHSIIPKSLKENIQKIFYDI